MIKSSSQSEVKVRGHFRRETFLKIEFQFLRIVGLETKIYISQLVVTVTNV